MSKNSSSKKVVRRVKAGAAGAKIAREDSAEKNAKKVTRKIAANNGEKSAKISENQQKIAAKKVGKKTDKAKKKVAKKAPNPNAKPVWIARPFVAFGRYVRDSWRELRQVRWPNRRATWALTLAVILFSMFFMILVVIFDGIFQWLIQEVIL